MLSPLLFIIVVEALSRESRTGCPWELLHADDLVIVAESLGDLKVRLKNWKDGLEEKGLRVNIRKTKVLCSRQDVSKLKIAPVKFSRGVSIKGVEANSILCLSCRNWAHKRCSGIKTSVRNCEDFICKTCSTTTGAVHPFPTCITIDRDESEIVSEFCYLGDVKGQADDGTDAVSDRIGSAWKAFHQLLPILANKDISLVNRGKVFKDCIWSVLLYRTEPWPLSTEHLSRNM